MIDETQIARLESELRRTKRVTLALAAVVVVAMGVAAGTDGQNVRGPFSVLDSNNAVKTVLQPNGDVEIGGKLLIGAFDVLAEWKKMGGRLAILESKVEDLEKRISSIGSYEIQQLTFDGSNVLGPAPQRNVVSEKAFGPYEFAKPLKNAYVAISSVYTVNNFHGGPHPVAEYYFTGRAEIDPANRRRMRLFVSHHMTDYSQGSLGNGYIRVLVIGEHE